MITKLNIIQWMILNSLIIIPIYSLFVKEPEVFGWVGYLTGELKKIVSGLLISKKRYSAGRMLIKTI